MLRKPANRIQQSIYEVLGNKDMQVKDINQKIAVSHVYIRQQLQLMMEAGLVEKVDERQPYMYRIKQMDIAHVRQVNAYKDAIMSDDYTTIPDMPIKPVVMTFRKIPKQDLMKALKHLELLVEAIEELNDEDKLLDTL